MIKFSGQLNLVIIFIYINFMATSLEHVSIGSVSSHLVTYSTAIIVCHGPILLSSIWNGTIISISQISNVKLGFTDIKGITVLGRGLPSRWQW